MNDLNLENKTQNLGYIEKWDNLSNTQKNEILSQTQILFNQITERELNFLSVIGKTGYFTINDIKNNINEKFKTSVYATRNKLIELNILVYGSKLKIGGKGAPIQPIMLTDIGCWLFTIVEKMNPKDSLLKAIAKDQKSTEHGFHIKKILDILQNAGYICSTEDDKETSFGKHSICDILAKKDLYEFRIEYEEGNYSKEGYYNKFKNILDVTDFLIFISYNNNDSDNLKRLFMEFVNDIYKGLNNFKQLNKRYLFTSLSELQNNPDVILDYYKKFTYNRKGKYSK